MAFIKRLNKMSLTTQVGITSALFFVLFGIMSINLMNRFVSSSFVEQTQNLTANFLEKQVDIYLDNTLLEHKRRSEEDIKVEHMLFNPFFKALSSNEVVKIRIWDNQETIVHSHVGGKVEKSEINMKIQGNRHYQMALQGVTNSEISQFDDKGEKFEGDQLLEIYVPIYLEGREAPVGVAEVYYQTDRLDQDIRVISQIIFVIGLVTFTFLFLVLLLITRRASKVIEKQNEEIKRAQEAEIVKSKQLLKLKDEFFFIATHDLKAPVAAITGFIEILKVQSKNLSDELKDSLSAIEEASERLSTLVEDLLEVARSDSGAIKVETKPVDIYEIINKTIKQASVKAGEKGVEIRIELDNEQKMVLGDREKLLEVMENLISNAVKYNKKQGGVEITTKMVGKEMEIIVSDTGLGIPKEEQKKVFSKFFRSSKSEVRKESGTGLGLFVVKMLVEKMNGRVEFESKENVGTTFRIYLPAA